MHTLIAGFSGELNASMPHPSESAKPRKLRPSQETVFQDLKGLNHTILNSPTGWGKTTTLTFLALDRLNTDPHAKIVISVPQRIIGSGFTRRQVVQMPDEIHSEWIPLDLCEKSFAKVATTIKWLQCPASELDRRVLVTTHASLVAALARIGDLTKLPRGLTTVIDESHHLQSGDAQFEGYNQLGAAINELIDLDFAVWLATAYFFRGDKLPILGERQLARFTRVFIPFDVHLAEMEHLKSYAYDFIAYRQSVIPDLEALLLGSQVPTLIYCPPEGHALLQGKTKTAFIKQIVTLLQRAYPGSQVWHPSLSRSARNVIVDLVDLADREQKVKYINAHKDRIAAILTVGMMQEGADWPPCARVIDLVPSTSDQTRNQKFGRLIRDYPGKEHIHYYSFLPFVLNQGENKQRETFSKIFAQLHASMILENALKPIKMPVQRKSSQRDSRDDTKDDGEELIDLLGQFNEPMQRKIEEKVSQTLIDLAGTTQGPLEWEIAGPAIMKVLERLGCSQVIGIDNIPALRDQIVLLWKRRKQPALVVEDLLRSGFDKIWATDILDPIKVFSAGVCGVRTFTELRLIIGANGQQQAEAWAKECAARYPVGALPTHASSNPQERDDAMKIAYHRMYKKGKKNGVFYPSVEAIFEAAGHHGVFETTDFQLEAEEWARECAARYKPGCLPYQKSEDPQKRYDGLKIANMRRAKAGEGTCTFYPSVEAIFEAAGHKGIFNKVNRQQEAEEWATACAARYQPGHLPSQKSTDPEARKDVNKLTHMRAAKRGKGQGRFYPTVEKIFEAAGHKGVFG